jgi:putative ABC transport system permease protein
MAKLFFALATMAILIACLGLFGLASFTAEQKMKEIGIRKVLGASALQVLLMLTARYVKAAMLAFIIGVPIAYVAIRSWMETFAYKAEIGSWFYLWACFLIISFTVITVGIESLRAARANPSDSIRHE